jgi:hypothetical protein
MKLKALFAAAGIAVAALGVTAPAQAHDGRYYGYDDRGYHDRGDYDRWDRRDWRDERRHWKKHHWRAQHRYGWNDGRRCWREWHHGDRVRICNYY